MGKVISSWSVAYTLNFSWSLPQRTLRLNVLTLIGMSGYSVCVQYWCLYGALIMLNCCAQDYAASYPGRWGGCTIFINSWLFLEDLASGRTPRFVQRIHSCMDANWPPYNHHVFLLWAVSKSPWHPTCLNKTIMYCENLCTLSCTRNF